MSRSAALDPVCSRITTNHLAIPGPAASTSQALDPVCRTITGGTQTATPEPAS